MRLFVAVFPPASVVSDLRRRLVDAQHADARDGRPSGEAERAPKARLTRADRWHITLRFLGEVGDDERADVERVLHGVPGRGKISLHLAGGGAFGQGRSTVLWAGVQGDLEALADLHDAVARAFDDEPVPFTPHLTIAYADSPGIRKALDGYVGPEWMVDEYVLVRSHHADGGGYERLRSWQW